MALSTKRIPLLGTLGLTSLLATAAGAQPISLDSLPFSPDLPTYRWFASTDPKNKNDDFFLLKPGETRRVPLAAGVLERLWSTSLFPDQLDLTLEAGARRRQLLLSGGKATRGLLENKTYTFFPGLKGDSLAKLDAGAAIIATNRASQPSKWYLQATVRPSSPPLQISKAKEVARRLFKISVPAGEEKEVETWTSPGQIYEFSVATDVPSAKTFQKLRLKAIFDGQSAIDAPLLSLAGQIEGSEQIQNAVADFDGSRLVLRWPMPFASAKISIVNEGDATVNLDIGARVSQFDQAPSPYRFCAVQQTTATKEGQPIDILDVDGAGALVGLALSIAPGAETTRRTFAYLEGNESIVADGKTFEGTGTEDYFSSAWYYPDKPFFHPFEGMTYKTPTPPSVSAYRLMIPDALPFKKSLKFNFEQGNGNNTSGMQWTWTAFWYQKPPLTASSLGSNETPKSGSASSEPTAPVAPGDRWKIGVAVGLGIILGVVSALTRRRRRRA
jgi:hypothetical protein